ncbi:acyl carrier protein [Actinomadura miaoliensis]|uniref:Carrier domain-containing protein n=1 Tax=Actinomadura miaoliensis TaxID=430685 RepID=A0ABP7UX15_9ACTN
MRNEDMVLETIQRVVSEVAKIPASELRLDGPVTGLVNVDSIVLMEIVARAELALDIEIDEELLFSIDTVGDFVAECQRLVADRVPAER